MSISPLEALEEHRYVYFGFSSHPTDKEPWQATPMMTYSDNLVQWNTVSSFGDLDGLRDGFVKKIGHDYYVIGTGGFYKTTDFIEFQKLGYITNTENWKTIWAPEIVQGIDEKYYITFCAGDSDTGVLDDYVTDFDPTTDTIGDLNIKVTFDDNALDNSWKIDPDIAVINGNYYLVTGGNYLLKSDQIWGPYQKVDTNFAPTPQKFDNHDSTLSSWLEGPELITDGESVRLFADQPTGNGLVFRSASHNNMHRWSDMENTYAPFQMRHGCILVNEKVSAQVDAQSNGIQKFNGKAYIQGLHANYRVALTCFTASSFQVDYEDNQTNSITFTAYDDGSPSYNFIANESTIYFNDDIYIIKSVEEDHDGYGTYTVTAIQYINSEIERVMQRNVRTGVLTYSVEDVLDFFLNDQVANPFGFAYHVYGEFDKQQIENLGNMSGKDMISKIVDTWPGAIVYPQKKVINVFTPEAFRKNHGRRIVYINNTSDIKLTEDSTGIINQVRCIGATKDQDQDTSQNQDQDQSNNSNDSGIVDDDGNKVDPKNVTLEGNAGNLDSAEGFAKSPINATWGVDKNRMCQNFAARSQRVHAWGVDVNKLYDTIKGAGVSPVWFFAYELQEQGTHWGWLNHTYRHGDAYQDAVSVCNWIKQWANTNGLNPAWTAPEGGIRANAGLQTRWNQEFPKGTIGRVYLQGTAAAVWELAGQNPNPRIGKPLSGCVVTIRAWGGHTMQNGKVVTETHTSTTTGARNGWCWPFPSVGEGRFMSAQRFGSGSGWIRPGLGTDFHDGLDFGSIDHPGNEVHAVHGGKVTYGPTWGSGGVNWYVVITDSTGLSVEYQEAFSNRGDIYINPGQTVQTGQVIGHRDTNHLHIGITRHGFPEAFRHAARNDGTWIDPQATIRNGIASGGTPTTTTTTTQIKKIEVKKADDSSSDDTEANVQYYFEPFILTDQHSVDLWGLHPGPDIQDDRFKDPEAMKAYAAKQLVPEPAISVEVTMDDNEQPEAGEQRYLTIPNEKTILGENDTQSAYTTMVTVVGYTWYPFDPSQGTDITFDNIPASILNYNNSRIRKVAEITFDRIFFGDVDPSTTQKMRNGNLWGRVIYPNNQEGDDDDSGKQSTDKSKSSKQPK